MREGYKMRLEEIINNFVKELQSTECSIVLDPSLIQDIIRVIFEEHDEDIVEISDDIGLDWGDESSPLQYELDFEYTFNGGVERSGLFIRLYLAATYGNFTLQDVIDYGDQISEFIYRESLGDGAEARNYFFKTIKEFNKNIPDDLRLFLDLNY